MFAVHMDLLRAVASLADLAGLIGTDSRGAGRLRQPRLRSTVVLCLAEAAAAKSDECIKTQPGGLCDEGDALGAPDCSFTAEEAGEILLDELTGIGDYETWWTSWQETQEYNVDHDVGIDCHFWDHRNDKEACAKRLKAAADMFEQQHGVDPDVLPLPVCDFLSWFDDEFDWPLNHTGGVKPEHGGPWPPPKPSLPPCALEAVCPPAWLPPDLGEICPACPEAPPCPAAPQVCALPEAPAGGAEGWVVAAAPGVIVALVLEAARALQCCRCRRAREDDGRTPSLPPLAAEEVWCADLAVGAVVRVSYAGEAMDHMWVVLWPARKRDRRGHLRGRAAYWVISADGDVREEDLSGRSPATGPSGGSLLDQATGDPPDGRRLLYRFRRRPSTEEILELAAECRKTMLRQGHAEAEEPRSVVTADGAERPGRELFPWAAVRRPWVLAEPLPDMQVGTLVDPLPSGALRDGAQALCWLDGCGRWARVEQVDEDRVVDYAAHRADELRVALGVPPWAGAGAELVEGTATPPPAAPSGRLPLTDRLDERLGLAPEEPPGQWPSDDFVNDVRTLRVDQLIAPGFRSHVSRRAKEECELMQGDKTAAAVAAGAAAARASREVPEGEATTTAQRAPLALASGDRDVFPLPRLARPLASWGGSRARVAGARLRREHELANGAIDSLNWLAGWGPDDVGPPRSLDAMGGKHAGIAQWVMEDVVGEAGRPYLKGDQKRMRRPINAIDFDSLPTPYFDPLLKRNQNMYHNCSREGIAVDSKEAEALLGDFKLFLGMTDVKDCFYWMRIPLSLAKFFALPAAPAHVSGLEGQGLEGAKLGADAPVYPAPGRDAALSGRALMKDRGPPLAIEVGPGQRGGACVYVDNAGALAPSESLATGALENWTGHFEALGTKLDLELMRSGVSDGRIWKVCVGLGGLLARGRATGRALEMVLGHRAFCGLALRGPRSSQHASCRFGQRHYLEAARLWAEVVKEIKMFCGLLALMVQDWWRPWNYCVLQTDASESGWGMAQSFWPRKVVEQVGRLPERARFRSAQGRAAPEGLREGPRSLLRPGSQERARSPTATPQLPLQERRAARDGRHSAALDERGLNGLDLAGDAGEDAEGDSSSSGSDSEPHADAILAAQDSGVSLLETLAVTQATRVRYKRYLDRFFSHVGLSRKQLLARTDEEIDELMCSYLTEHYLQGEQSSFSDQTVAAWVNANLAFGRVGGSVLPRT
ncbi:unnamed protein product [Prorocentrum cordatum]|uniref:Uncharacterized protein n=1 Tax=Prorocentrum cordatum TaxID=2364126 RepID=A0ABN9W2Q2_9DINO|nr:unnamed protein product [Polarella glacialis]